VLDDAKLMTFVVPALNEEEIIEETVKEILEISRPLLQRLEVILVDDGSTDKTGEVMDRIAVENDEVRVLHNDGNIGLGASYQRGLQDSRGDYFMLLCGDGGMPASSLPPILEQVGKADIVIPYMTNLKTIKSPFRYLLSRTYSTLLNVIFGQNLHYFNGLPVHRVDLLNTISITSRGFGFQGEILIKLLKSGCSYVEVPVLGAENSNKSSALRIPNIFSVAKTFLSLWREINSFVRRARRDQEKKLNKQ